MFKIISSNFLSNNWKYTSISYRKHKFSELKESLLWIWFKYKFLKTCHFEEKIKSSVKCTRFYSCHEYFNVSKLPNLMSGEIVKMFFDLTNLFIRDSPWRDVRAKLPINSFAYFLKHFERDYHFLKHLFVKVITFDII